MPRTPAELRTIIMSAPDPLVGHIFGYEQAANAVAKAMLLVCEENPALLDPPEPATDIDRMFHDAHWKAACARWPGLDRWLGGLSGFQFGWATNAVRYILSKPQVGNPAVVSVPS